MDYRFVPVFAFRDGKIVRMDRYGDRAEALKAVGLARFALDDRCMAASPKIPRVPEAHL